MPDVLTAVADVMAGGVGMVVPSLECNGFTGPQSA